MARFLAPDRIGRIHVIVNDIDEAACRKGVEALRGVYGPLSDRLEIVPPDALFALRPEALGPHGVRQRFRLWLTRNRRLYPLGVLGGWRGNRGWSVQQALKLTVARFCRADNILILDAKNHFVRPVTTATFVAASGRPRFTEVETASDKQKLWIAGSFRLLGAEPPGKDQPKPPTVTPFCVPRQLLAECIDELEMRVGPAEAFFAQARGDTSEFMLIFAHGVKHHGSWSAIGEPGLPRAATIFRRSTDDMIDAVLDDLENGRCDIFSIHNSQLPKLGAEQKARIIRIWQSLGLPTDLFEASGAQI